MRPTLPSLLLILSSLVALAVGLSLMLVPDGFYASYGITLPNGPDLRSDLRGPGAAIAAFGIWQLLAAARPLWQRAGLFSAIAVYGAFVLGRVVGILLDGPPINALLAVMGVEMVLALAAALILALGFAPRHTA